MLQCMASVPKSLEATLEAVVKYNIVDPLRQISGVAANFIQIYVVNTKSMGQSSYDRLHAHPILTCLSCASLPPDRWAPAKV